MQAGCKALLITVSIYFPLYFVALRATGKRGGTMMGADKKTEESIRSAHARKPANTGDPEVFGWESCVTL